MKKYSEKIMHVVFLIAACASILAVILICAFLFVNGIPTIGKIGLGNFVLGKIWMQRVESLAFPDDHRKYLCNSRSDFGWSSSWNSCCDLYGKVL